MEDDWLGVGFVGAGFITREFHATTLERIRGADAAGVMKVTVSKAELVADDYREAGSGDPFVTSGVRELVRTRRGQRNFGYLAQPYAHRYGLGHRRRDRTESSRTRWHRKRQNMALELGELIASSRDWMRALWY